MLQTKKATFVADTKEQVVAITQLSTQITTKVDAYSLLSLIRTDLSEIKKKTIFCSKANMPLSLGANAHLSSAPDDINTYLNNGFIEKLEKYILDSFPDIEKTSEPLSAPNQEVETAKKQELSKEEKINNAPLIKMAEYEEPRYDYEYCNGYPNHNFIGIIGKNGEIIEIDFNAHENLFDPKSGNIKNYPVAHAFNLYDENNQNLANRNKFILICNHIKEEALFQVNLMPTENIKYYGKLLKAREEYKLAVGRLPQTIKFKSSLSELIDETDDEELPWIE
ncbi:hypothetical protein NG754_02610 [Aliarcobacter cryaerophilus]|uniref:hypothetical protein n=1 Tax=Aliarcobacter cryaerophilus TaxID=28198 RepID=UPI003DA39E40